MNRLLPFLLGFLISCSDKPTEESKDLRKDLNATVEAMPDYKDVSAKKIALFRIVGTDSFFTLESGDIINNEWFHNHRVGDSAHFDMLNKTRIFTIKGAGEESRSDTGETRKTREERLFQNYQPIDSQ